MARSPSDVFRVPGPGLGFVLPPANEGPPVREHGDVTSLRVDDEDGTRTPDRADLLEAPAEGVEVHRVPTDGIEGDRVASTEGGEHSRDLPFEELPLPLRAGGAVRSARDPDPLDLRDPPVDDEEISRG